MTIDFLEQPDRTAIKVCGVRTAAQAEAILALGVDAVGINFWPASKRFLAPEEAQDWLPNLRFDAAVVGLFVNAELDEILEHYDNELFGIAQLHGDETAEYCQCLVEREIPFIKALGVGEDGTLGDLSVFSTDYLLLDAAQEGYGGGGISFDWDLAGRIIADHPEKRFLLAGGIRPNTVGEAIRKARPAAIDVASGVESAPGIKDLGLVEDLVRRVRKADALVG